MVVGWVMQVFLLSIGECAMRVVLACDTVEAEYVRIQFFRSGMNLAVPVIRDHMLGQVLYSTTSCMRSAYFRINEL